MTVLDDVPYSSDDWSQRASTAETSYEAAGWTREGQLERFAAVLAALNPQPSELLVDYGCGTGALTEHLPADIDYLGYDSAAGMITRARADHPGRAFTIAEPSRADLIACIGTFNLPGGWSKERTWHTIRHLFDTTGCRAIAVSLYAGPDPRCLTYTESEIEQHGLIDFCSRYRRWRHNDILITHSRGSHAW